MITFFTEYGMFLAKLVTVIATILIAVWILARIVARAKAVDHEHLIVKKLNDKYQKMSLVLKSAALPRKVFKKELSALKMKKKHEQKSSINSKKKRIFVIEFVGDIRAREGASLREIVTAILTIAEPKDEVVLVLESAGGTIHGYGFAASQLLRIREKGIKLTIAVDKVAASGGYMMACVGDRIIAAPFAIIGSIGVIGQMPNFNRLLKNLDIDYEQVTAGEYKRTLSIFGENTDTGRRKAQENIDETHQLFKDFVIANRSQVDIDQIATGEHWYGTRALELNLVDELCTSDDYLVRSAENADLFLINYVRHKPFTERIFSGFASAINHLITK